MGWLPLAVLAGAILLDLVLGEPPAWLHPVVWMGRITGVLVRRAPRRGPLRALVVGGLISLAVPAAFAAAALVVEQAIAQAVVSPTVRVLLLLAVAIPLLKSTFALRALGDAAREMRRALSGGRIDQARSGLRSLCSRDPSALDEPALVAATVESVAENTSDSFVAPLFFYALFGLPGAFFYRAVNTLDAMIGYRGELEHLGKAAARLDDLCNLVPARLTALVLLAAGWLHGLNGARGLRILVRDGARTESPNAGRPIAAMAGLLGVELEKQGHYRLGDPIEQIDASTIDRAWSVAFAGAALATPLLALLLEARRVLLP